MFYAGAKAFINKQATRSEIKRTLLKVMKGETVYTTFIKKFQVKRTIDSYLDPKYGLTKGQKEILTHFIEGLPPSKIAGRLNKKSSAVSRSIYNIRKIFKAENNLTLMKTLMELDV